jgi:hypothetical protein
MRLALAFATLNAGSNNAARIAMMAMTTSNSTSVNARPVNARRDFIMIRHRQTVFVASLFITTPNTVAPAKIHKKTGSRLKPRFRFLIFIHDLRPPIYQPPVKPARP